MTTWQVPGRLERHWPWAVYVAVALLAVAGLRAGTGWPPLPFRAECAPGVAEATITRDGTPHRECVGVTDDFAFEPRLAGVAAALRANNAAATRGSPGSYVTVAYVGPLTHPDPRVVHRLEGAVAGAQRANQSSVIGDRPRVRLLLANTGSDGSRWGPVVTDLIARTRTHENVRAVAGVGLSQDSTLRIARRLAGASLAMVGDIVSAAEIDRRAADGFARVNPHVGSQVAALARQVRADGRLRTATLVGSASRTDLYTLSLAAAFKRSMGGLWRAGGANEYPFGDDPENEFDVIARNLCSGTSPDLVFYAGRAQDLPRFIGYLAQRTCRAEPLTVVTGSDAVMLTGPQAEYRRALAALRAAPLTLLYVPLAEPSLLRDPRHNPDADQWARFERDYTGVLGFDGAHLRSGWGIMAHDAVLTAVRAVRLASGASGRVPSASQVRNMLYLIKTSSSAVPGASGYVEIDAATGNRVVRRLPVVRLHADGRVELLRFQKV
ncbi:ABC transporter substrate-binding protein [Actinomadura flavalba]|uniref:ABC transporter substrate-binding protein n=1 Tax=Actinomadura flavalba TaxID=1120938 RepID=UPI00036DA4B8|nr:hypothetical protein [Actinomadura flavalba]